MLPNYTDKYDKPAIFTPRMALDYRIWKNKKPDFKVPKAVIFCINWDLLDYIKKNYECEQVEGFFADCYLVQDVLVVSKFGIGAPTTVALLEEFIAYGVKNFFLAGNAGAISPELNIGDLVVCEKAIRDEGVSYHYMPADKAAEASHEMTEKLKRVLEKNKLSYSAGVSWTTDAFFRETVDEVSRYQQQGVLTVDMEASAIFAVAQYRGVNACVLFNISDSLASLEWRPEWHNANKDCGKMFDVAMETIDS